MRSQILSILALFSICVSLTWADDCDDCTPDALYFCFPDEGLGPTLEVGTEFDMLVTLDVVSEGIQGWSFGVAHDPLQLEILEATVVGLDLPVHSWEIYTRGD